MKTKQKQGAVGSAILASAAVAVLLLGGCSPADSDATVGQKVDSAIASAEVRGNQAKADIKSEVADAKQATTQAASDLKERAANAANTVADKVQDATITATVTAELAKDEALSALKINVDTVDGRVSLRGTAPSAEARERATRLASSVKGVVDVENKLEVRV